MRLSAVGDSPNRGENGVGRDFSEKQRERGGRERSICSRTGLFPFFSRPVAHTLPHTTHTHTFSSSTAPLLPPLSLRPSRQQKAINRPRKASPNERDFLMLLQTEAREILYRRCGSACLCPLSFFENAQACVSMCTRRMTVPSVRRGRIHHVVAAGEPGGREGRRPWKPVPATTPPSPLSQAPEHAPGTFSRRANAERGS